MTQPLRHSIREALLAEIEAEVARITAPSRSGTLQQTSILNAVARKLGVTQDPDVEQAILTQWDDLFRTGLLSWGLNLSNPNPPFFHLTEPGRRALQKLTRDPSNPAGYLRHLASVAILEPIPLSYLTEGLECYVAGFFRAAAVMVGVAAECTVLDLRDRVVEKLEKLGKPIPRNLEDWRIKTVSDTLHSFFETNGAQFERELQEWFDAYWSAFTQQIRAARNDAGHPASIDPVTADTVHASLLIFPELAKLASKLTDWVAKDLT